MLGLKRTELGLKRQLRDLLGKNNNNKERGQSVIMVGAMFESVQLTPVLSGLSKIDKTKI